MPFPTVRIPERLQGAGGRHSLYKKEFARLIDARRQQRNFLSLTSSGPLSSSRVSYSYMSRPGKNKALEDASRPGGYLKTSIPGLAGLTSIKRLKEAPGLAAHNPLSEAYAPCNVPVLPLLLYVVSMGWLWWRSGLDAADGAPLLRLTEHLKIFLKTG